MGCKISEICQLTNRDGLASDLVTPASIVPHDTDGMFQVSYCISVGLAIVQGVHALDTGSQHSVISKLQ